MSFITQEELESHIRGENIRAISRGDETKVPAALREAAQEASGYLNRFDFETLFNATGEDRDPILMLYIKDIAKWHFITVCQAGVDYNAAEDRYNKAIAWLSKIQSGKLIMRNWPLFQGEDQPSNSFTIRSNEKRGNHF